MSGVELSRGRRSALIGLLILIWGSTWSVIKVGLAGIPPFTGVALRFAIAGALLLLLFRPLGGRFEHSARERGLWIANAALTFSLSYAVVYWVEQWLPSGLTSILFATFPLFVAVMAHFWLPGEGLTARMTVGTVLGFVGVLLIFSEDLVALAGAGANRAAAIMLLSPMAAAAGNVMVKKWGRGLHPLSLTAIPMLMTGAVMGLLAAGLERTPVHLDRTSVGALLYLAVVGSAVTFSLYFWLLDRLPATQLSLIAYCAPLMAVVIGVLFLAEPLSGRTLLGGLMVIVGVGLGSAAGKRPAEQVSGRRRTRRR